MGSSHVASASRLTSLFLVCGLPLCLVASEPLSDSPPSKAEPKAAKAEVASLKVIGPKSVEVGKRCVLVAETKANKVTWKLLTPGAETLAIDGRRLAVWAPPGTYKFLAQIPAGDEVVSQEHVLTVTGAIPPPVPPVPPGPNPPAPDAFFTDVANAYRADATPDKVTAAIKLSGLYRAAAKSTVNDPTIKTYGELTADMVKAGKAIFPQGTLPKVRESIAKRLDPILGVDLTRPLTPAERAKCAAEFNTVADALLAAIK